MSSISNRIILLFCHGGSYNKDCWRPIIRHLKQSPLLQRVPCEFSSFNWQFHGEKRDQSFPTKLVYRNGDQASPRIEHPMSKWPEWAPADLAKEIELLREDDAKLARHTHVVGIGHSLGGTSLLKVETTRPGTLDGIIAFESVFDDGSFSDQVKETMLDMLVNAALSRESEWDSMEALQEHLKTSRSFKRWHPEALAAFLEQGVEKTEDGRRFRLVVSPAMEASIYCHEFVPLMAEDFAKAKCKMVMEHAERTVFFREKPAREIAEKLKGQYILADPIPKTSHSMVVEAPEACAQHIVDGLLHFPVIQQALASASKM